MEVEIKLRLPIAAADQHLSDALAASHLQENLFFDTTASDLSSALAALRIRFYDADAKCVLTLKARAKIVDGISRVEGDEEVIDYSVGRAIVAEPAKMASLLVESRIVRRAKDEIGVNVEFVCSGGFRNVRAVYGWEEGLILELDETQYEFGTSYEIECETAEPERVKVLLEGFLKEKGSCGFPGWEALAVKVAPVLQPFSSMTLRWPKLRREQQQQQQGWRASRPLRQVVVSS